jgi:hypothetical protein
MDAVEARMAWMRRMGLGEDEIQESLNLDPPTSVKEEMEQYDALDRLDQFHKENPNFTNDLRTAMDSIKEENGLPSDSKVMVCMSCRKPVDYDEKTDEHFCACQRHRLA